MYLLNRIVCYWRVYEFFNYKELEPRRYIGFGVQVYGVRLGNLRFDVLKGSFKGPFKSSFKGSFQGPFKGSLEGPEDPIFRSWVFDVNLCFIGWYFGE